MLSQWLAWPTLNGLRAHLQQRVDHGAPALRRHGARLAQPGQVEVLFVAPDAQVPRLQKYFASF